MIQFNLLPLSKLESVKARHSERLILTISVIAALVSIGLLVLSIVFVGLQKFSMSTADKNIAARVSQINQIANLNEILTIQNQLKTLVQLHDTSPAAIRLFSYLPQITPTQASISQLVINFDQHAITVNGTASSLQAVNEFANTLKFTTYKLGVENSNKPAFTSVVLANFGRDVSGASYSLQLSFTPVLFDSSQKVTLNVPQNYITTRSFTELPNTTLFGGLPSNSTSGGSSQ